MSDTSGTLRERVLICGSRDEQDIAATRSRISTLAAIVGDIEVVIEGGATGVDRIARRWARDNGIPVDSYKAEWSRFGHAAGPKRNRRMILEGRPTVVFALPGGNGTSNMVSQAQQAGIKVLKLGADGTLTLSHGAPTRHDETPGDTPGRNNKNQDSVGPGADG